MDTELQHAEVPEVATLNGLTLISIDADSELQVDDSENQKYLHLVLKSPLHGNRNEI